MRHIFDHLSFLRSAGLTEFLTTTFGLISFVVTEYRISLSTADVIVRYSNEAKTIKKPDFMGAGSNREQ